ncbi:MAG: CidA/LrgA family protein [Clostridia bacterium]|nr:CidA/LrgA family protein [Clostridia bacterium]
MKYVCQLGIILGFSLAGELLAALVPLPVPAAIWGMVLLLAALLTRFLRVEAVGEVGRFLVTILPLLFVVPTVGLMACFDLVFANLVPILVILVVGTVVTFGVGGLVTKIFTRGGDRDA